MALTNQQVQAAYLAITGRPAEGSAVTWASASFADVASLVSSIIDIRKGGDFSNNKETFVENLYQNLLGRASDAEGKEFWLKALNDGASYAQVAQNFINVVLGQSQTEDLYKLQNKLGIAEQISAQINTFQGGAAAEATLKALMSTVNVNTTFANVEDSVKEFKGQNVDITTVTVQQGAEEPAKGSDEHATTFNATYDLGKDGSISIDDNSSFANTLNLSVKGLKDEAESLNSIGTVSGIKTLNITTDTNIKTSNLDSSKVGGATSVTFKGSSKDTFTATAGKAMTLLDTGAGDDIITLNAKVATVKAGNGNDTIKVGNALTMSIDGGAGTDAVILTDDGNGAKTTFSNVEILAGTGTVKQSEITKFKTIGSTDTGTYGAEVSGASTITVDGVSGNLNLSSLSKAEGVTALATLNLNKVGKGASISLSSEDNIKEVISLNNTASAVKVSGIATGDSVGISGLELKNAAASGTTLTALATGTGLDTAGKMATLAISTANQFNNHDTVLAAIQNTLTTSTKNAIAGTYILAEDTGDNAGAALWKVTAVVTAGNGTAGTGGEIELIATFSDANFAAVALSGTGSANTIVF